MPSLTDGIDWLLDQEPGHPAAAAALTLLAKPPATALSRLDAALKSVAPRLTEQRRAAWGQVLLPALGKAAISTPRRIAAFLGQCAVESVGFRVLEEDLSYSTSRLCQVWPNRFPDETAAEACAMNPEVLANTVYADRMGNGDAATGDGWRFRGRGLIQLTGRSAYQQFAQARGIALDDAIDHAATDAGAADTAAWFWSTNHLNELADTWSLEKITHIINGGSLGAAERARLSDAALHTIGA